MVYKSQLSYILFIISLMKLKNDAMAIKNITAIEKAKMQMKAFVIKTVPIKAVKSKMCY